MAQVDLSKYPAPNAVEPLDYETVLARLVDSFATLFPVDDQQAADLGVPSRASITALMAVEGNLMLKQLQAFAYHSTQLRARVNDGIKATMLPLAVGADLDNLAAFYFVERKSGEKDDNLRARLLLAVDGFSVAGPRNAYKFHAISADERVKDASVVRGDDGDVIITVLSNEGDGTAAPELVAVVLAATSADDVRPLSDTVIVQPVEVVSYGIEATIWTYSLLNSDLIRIAAVDAAKAYVAEMHLLGFDITLSGLYRALHQEGVQRVEIAEPQASVIIAPSQTAYCNPDEIVVILGGTDE